MQLTSAWGVGEHAREFFTSQGEWSVELARPPDDSHLFCIDLSWTKLVHAGFSDGILT